MKSFAEKYYLKYWQHRLKNNKVYKKLPTRVKVVLDLMPKSPDTHILDIGTGEGSLGKGLQKFGKFNLDGVEISEPAIKLAAPYYRTIYDGDITDESLSAKLPKNYDVAVSLEVIEHLVDHHALLTTAYEHLKPGGLFFLSIPNTAWWKYRLDLLRGEFIPDDPCYSDLDHLHFFTLPSISKEVASHGFIIEAIDGVFTLPWYFGRLPAGLQRFIGKLKPNLFGYQVVLKLRKPFTSALVAHFVNDYLNPSESWIYNQIKSQTKFQSIILTRNLRNSDQFPSANVYAYPLLFELLSPDTKWWWLRKILALAQKYIDISTNNESDYYQNILKTHQPKLVHAHYGSGAYQILSIVQKLKIPLVVSFYGGDVTGELVQTDEWKKRYAQVFAYAQLCIVKGPVMRQKLISLGCPAKKIIILDHGVDIEKIPYTPPKVTRKVNLLIASRLVKFKGIAYALKAFRKVQLANPSTSLTIIGSGEEEKKLIGLTNQLALKNVNFIPFIAQHQLLKMIGEYHIFLQPSVTINHRQEGIPTSLIERIAAGLPVVAFDHADINQVVHHGKNGYLVPEGDIEQFADQIIQLINTPKLWERFSQYGRKLIESEFNCKNQTASREMLYNKIIGQKKSKSS